MCKMNYCPNCGYKLNGEQVTTPQYTYPPQMQPYYQPVTTPVVNTTPVMIPNYNPNPTPYMMPWVSPYWQQMDVTHNPPNIMDSPISVIPSAANGVVYSVDGFPVEKLDGYAVEYANGQFKFYK